MGYKQQETVKMVKKRQITVKDLKDYGYVVSITYEMYINTALTFQRLNKLNMA